MMDLKNPVVNLCSQGAEAEYQGQITQARAFYRQAWELAGDDFEACIAAHYMARIQDDPEAALYWNEVALERAQALNDERIASFYPSLFVNLGRSHELLGHMDKAEAFYKRAAELGLDHGDLDAGGLRNPSKV